MNPVISANTPEITPVQGAKKATINIINSLLKKSLNAKTTSITQIRKIMEKTAIIILNIDFMIKEFSFTLIKYGSSRTNDNLTPLEICLP